MARKTKHKDGLGRLHERVRRFGDDSPRLGLRYAIYEGSQSAHCCFDATVVDTTKPDIIGEEHYYDKYRGGQYHYEAMCECFDMEDAEMICDALNRGLKAPNGRDQRPMAAK